MDVWTYFLQRERELKELSLVCDGPFCETVAEERGSNGSRGRIFAKYWLTDRAFLNVAELIQVEDGHITRLEYAYYLVVIDGDEIWGEERDPTHDPIVHAHSGSPHSTGTSTTPVSFKEAATRAWDDVTAREAF